MKTILVPTDYSPAADNALNHAIALAGYMKARIVLFHVFHLPVTASDIPGMYAPLGNITETEQERLEEYASVCRQGAAKNIPVSCVTRAGFAVDEIPEYADEEHADLIVFGVSQTESIAHSLFGSAATGVMEHTSRDILLVPESAPFKVPERLAYACNLGHEVCTAAVERLRAFAALFQSEVLVIHVEDPAEPVPDQKALSCLALEAELGGTSHSMYFPSNSDVVEELVEFEDGHNIDILVMVPGKHSMLGKLFHTGKTREMAFKTHVPVLVLHETK